MRVNLNEQLNNLAMRGAISTYQPDISEVKNHLDTAKQLLADAKKAGNSNITKFTVAYSAGHNFLTAALKMQGYRTTSEKGHRQLLYDILDGLFPGASSAKDTMSRAHNQRNKAEYEGDIFDPTDGLVEDLVKAVENVQQEASFYFNKFKNDRKKKEGDAAKNQSAVSSVKDVGTQENGEKKGRKNTKGP
jgi:hypothetical protein